MTEPAQASGQAVVQLPGVLADLAGARRVPVPLVSTRPTLDAVLDELARVHPAVERRIRDESGALRRYVNIYLDDDDVRRGAGLQTPVCDGQVVLVVPSIAGGSAVRVAPAPDDELVRTFHLRRGRVTPAQRRALRDHHSLILDPVGPPLAWAALFGRESAVVLEIGFGMGEATLELASREPERDVVAVDVHTPGVGRLLGEVHRLGLPNVRVVHGDALELLQHRVPASSLWGVRVFFPDPWPKTRHRKRRLFRSATAELLARALRPGGFIHLATDDPCYADRAREVVNGHELLGEVSGAVRPEPRPPSRFEHRALTAGRPVQDVWFTRTLAS